VTYGDKIAIFEDQISQLIEYLELKIQQHDWHGVADAAMDIRELKAKIDVLKEYEEIEL
jgi:hypothetical protein